MVGRTSTIALTRVSEPYVVMLAEQDIEAALSGHRGLAAGVNTREGGLVNASVARALGEKV